MSFRDEAEVCALAWKASTAALPEGAREEGLYRERGEPLALCLPSAYANQNLLAEARDPGLAAFAAAGIPWHHGGPSQAGNHLLSSQIQCVNALAPMIDDPGAVRATFSDVLDIAEVLPFGDPTSPSAHVAFEWVGLSDHLNEHPGGAGTRGANNTSADAAIRYRASDGGIEIALIEWKYVERYSGQPLSGGDNSNEVRRQRYQLLFEDPASPVRVDRFGLDEFFVEPVYQLLRLQLLAWRMEATHELEADRVRLVYAAPSRNAELWGSLRRPTHLAVAAHLGDLWPRLLRRPDRFVLYDTARLLAPGAVTSEEFKVRYGHLAVSAAYEAPVSVRASREVAEGRARSAVGTARDVCLRVAGEGGVFEQVLEIDSLDHVPVARLEELAARAEEVAELVRRLRADQIGKILHAAPSGDLPAE